MHINIPYRALLKAAQYAGVPLLVIGVTASLGFTFHLRGQRVVEEQLRERMLSTVSIAALNIDAEKVERVHTSKDTETVAYRTLVEQLKHIRALTPHARFVYIMRQTDDPMTVSFVADADAFSDVSAIDTNKNGIVDADEEPGLPGDPYSITDIPSLQYDAFIHPVVEQEFTIDQWGKLISAFAPIQDAHGKVVAVLGIDLEADAFFEVTQNTFSLLAVVFVTFVGALLAVYILFIIHARHLESLKQLDTERSSLLDLATHQLGMPLATFRWWLELLKERDDGKFCKRDDVCDQLQEGIDRMDSIITSLNQAGKLQESTYVGANERCALGPVVKDLLKDLHKTLSFKKQTIQTHFQKNLPLMHIDAKLCSGMLRELFENASTYSPKNSVISISACAVRGGVEVKVSDQGCGISTEDLPHIFEQFKRGSNATKYKPVGNGLGLYIVKRIVKRSRGKIRVESALHSGTTFIIVLPQAS